MNSDKEKEVKEKARVFLENNTIVFIKTIKVNGYDIWNGYIKEISQTFFILKDIKTEAKIPIFFKDLIKEGSVFEPSRKNKGELK